MIGPVLGLLFHQQARVRHGKVWTEPGGGASFLCHVAPFASISTASKLLHWGVLFWRVPFPSLLFHHDIGNCRTQGVHKNVETNPFCHIICLLSLPTTRCFRRISSPSFDRADARMSDRPGACAVDPRQRRGDAVDVLRCLGTLWGRASFFRMPVSIGLVRGLTIEPLKELPFGFPCARVWLKGQFDLTLYWDPNSIPDVGNQGPIVTLPARGKRLFSGAGITVMPLKQAEPLVSPGPWDLDLTDGQFAVPPF